MSEIALPKKLDDQALKALHEVITLLNTGIKSGNVAGGANISNAAIKRSVLTKVGVGVTQIAVRHKLGKKPGFVRITMTSPGQIQLGATRSDNSFVYLIADAANRTADLEIVE